jgi:hypothetical protein
MHNFSQKYAEMRADGRIILKRILQNGIVTVDWVRVLDSSVHWCPLVNTALKIWVSRQEGNSPTR